MLTLDQLQAGQTNPDGTTFTRDQLATAANAATLPAPTTAPTNPPTNTITADSLTKSPTPLTLPQPDTSTNGANALVAGASTTPKSLDDYIKLLTPPTSPEQTQADSLTQSINDLLGQTTSKGTDQLTAEQNANIPQLKQSISDINGQITTRLASYKAAYQDLENNPQQLASVVGSKQAVLQKNEASEIGLLQARGQALQGNLSAAQDTVNRAIDLKYSTLTDEINVKLKQLDLVQGQLTKQEQIRSDALKLYLNDQQTKLEQQKADDKQLQTLAINAASAGAPNNLVTQALNTKDPVQASEILNQYLHATGEGTGTSEGTLFKVPTATELGGAQFYKYPSSPQVYTSAGKAVDLTTYKQLTNQTNVPDAQVNFSGIKTISPTSTTTTIKTTVAQDVTSMSSQLTSVAGKVDHYVSPEDWKTALAAWQKAGRSAASFYTNFSNFINPADKQDYK